MLCLFDIGPSFAKGNLSPPRTVGGAGVEMAVAVRWGTGQGSCLHIRRNAPEN